MSNIRKDVTTVDDGTILKLYFARDEQAIRETDRAYGRKLYSLSQRILSSREDAQESVNDTYLQTWRSIPPKKPRYFYAFLAAICRNLSLNRLDWNLAAKRKAEVVYLSQEMELCIPDRRQEDHMESRQLRQILESFLDTLPKEHRLIFLRRYLYMDTIAEIAARYGLSKSNVKTRLHRTREKLRIFLQQEGVCL